MTHFVSSTRFTSSRSTSRCWRRTPSPSTDTRMRTGSKVHPLTGHHWQNICLELIISMSILWDIFSYLIILFCYAPFEEERAYCLANVCPSVCLSMCLSTRPSVSRQNGFHSFSWELFITERSYFTRWFVSLRAWPLLILCPYVTGHKDHFSLTYIMYIEIFPL